MYKNLLHQFVLKFATTYGTHNVAKFDRARGISGIDITFPLQISSEEKEKLEKELEKMQEGIDLARRTSEPQLISLLNLYYQSENLEDDYLQILRELGFLRNVVYGFLEMKAKTEFETNNEKYRSARNEISDKIKKYVKKLVNDEIRIA